MKIVKVTYTTKPEFSAQNQSNIKAVMTDLKQINNPNINYHACMGADEKTFIHTAFFKSDEERQVLNDLPSFKHFQHELKNGGFDTPPQQELLSLVGSSKDIFITES
ncbi:MAG: hypothetical protein JWN76_3721 [Chitinophagaceae bacterium]|nr:hypothetical protein [Chitinophagaceae bacterium]